MIYKVETIKDGTEKYFFIRNLETMSIEELPSKYLMHKIKCKRSPNTVKRTAFSICYYMKYMAEKEMELTEVYQLDYEKQTEYFVEFLYWLKAGNHTEQTSGEKKCPNEGTCNAYLKDVFRFYLFIEAEYEQYGSLKTLSYNQIIAVNQVGVKKVLRNHSFKAYLKEEEHRGRTAKENQIITLRPDCLTRENGQDMIEIYQVKTKRYKKPISKELAKLLQSSIEYTQEKFGDTEYIFVNEKEPDRPMQYMAIKTKVMSMIQEKQLKDDHGELFGFGTHMFRHYYGVKLTEMHLDDWTIARLLGHKRLNNVQHYRKMSNQRMADETREVRQMMSDIIYMSLARWGEEYEQIRQDD